MQKVFHYIHGKKTAPIHGEYLENVNPATGQVFSFLARGTTEDINAAVQAASESFKTWSQTSIKDRVFWLRAIAQEIEKRKKDFASLESRDQGKPVALAEKMDINRAILNFNYFADLLESEKLESRQSGHHPDLAVSYTLRKPVGVVGLIAPWNLPLYLLTWKIAPALACGNTVVCKPSEMTSMTADLLADVVSNIGLPNGVLNIVYGLGAEAGQALVEHPDVPLISFTGGTATGKKLYETAAKKLKRVSLELGGKNPNIIFADCDLERSVQATVRSSFLNQGEICLCGSRILIEEKIYDQFVHSFLSSVKLLRVGDPADSENFMGALISKAHLEKVKSYIEIAKQEGAEILCGGKTPQSVLNSAHLQNGFWLEPTVIANVQQNSRCVQEEIFGPVVTLQKFASIDEAICLANDSKYGLSASVWSESKHTVERCSQELQVGTVWINTWLHRDLNMPFGGAKQSGIGREGGRHSFDFFSELTTVCMRSE